MRNTVWGIKETTEREREAIPQMPGPFEFLLVLVHWTGICIGHTQGKRSDLSPQGANLMDSALKMLYLLMCWPRSSGSVSKRRGKKWLWKGMINQRAGLKHQPSGYWCTLLSGETSLYGFFRDWWFSFQEPDYRQLYVAQFHQEEIRKWR